MRDYLLGLAKGEGSVPISVVMDKDALKKQDAYQRLLTEQLQGKRPLHVVVENGDTLDGDGQGKLFGTQ